MSALEAVGLAVLQTGIVVATAPLLNGAVKRMKARLQLRQGPPLLQSYQDLAKWLSKSERVADNASFVHWLAPVGVLAATFSALLFVPLLTAEAPFTTSGDILVVIGLLALGRALLTLGGMDSGAAFGQMGSSREVAIGSLVEPVLLVSLAALCLEPQSTRLEDIMRFGDNDPGAFLGLGWALAAAAFAIVLVAETGRIPVDNPDTHLELTMVHEGPLLEYAGRDLALLQWTAAARHWIVLVLVAELALPHPGPFGVQLLALATSLAVLVPLLAMIETAQAKLRILRVPLLLGGGLVLCLMGLAANLLGVSA